MRHAIALGLKLAVYLVIFGLTHPFMGARTLGLSMILAAVHTLLLWFADLLVLPRFGNLVAAAGDAMTLVVGTFLVAGAVGRLPNPATLPIAVVAGTAFELWFHRWLESAAIVE